MSTHEAHEHGFRRILQVQGPAQWWHPHHDVCEALVPSGGGRHPASSCTGTVLSRPPSPHLKDTGRTSKALDWLHQHSEVSTPPTPDCDPGLFPVVTASAPSKITRLLWNAVCAMSCEMARRMKRRTVQAQLRIEQVLKLFTTYTYDLETLPWT